MANSADPDQLASFEANSFEKQGISGFSRTTVKLRLMFFHSYVLSFLHRFYMHFSFMQFSSLETKKKKKKKKLNKKEKALGQ